MYSCLKFDIEISMLEEKSLMVLIVLGNLKYNKKINIQIRSLQFTQELFDKRRNEILSQGAVLNPEGNNSGKKKCLTSPLFVFLGGRGNILLSPNFKSI